MTIATSPSAASSAEAAARAKADALAKDDGLAQSKGDTPQQVEARQRVARLFCEIHLPKEDPAVREARLASTDYTCPVVVVNARGVDLNAPKKGGFFGLRRHPTLLLSAQFPPKTPDDPVYALEYFIVKS